MKIRYCWWLLFISIQLLIGIVIYLQSGKLLIGFVFIDSLFPEFNNWLVLISNYFPQFYKVGWVSNHLPDILWSSACSSLIVGIWVNQFTLLKLLPLGIGCAIFYEMLQLFGVTGGTYDWLDMFYSLIAGLLSTVLTYLLLLRESPGLNKQNNKS